MEKQTETSIGFVEGLQPTSSGNSFKFKIRGKTFYTKNPDFKEGDRIAFKYSPSKANNGTVFCWGVKTTVNPKDLRVDMDTLPQKPKEIESISFREQLILRQNALNWCSQLYNQDKYELDVTFPKFVKAMFEEVWGIPWSLTEPSK